MLRRLNRREYANTIRDLLGIHVDAGHALPEDGAGGEGFDNAAETLFVSQIHAEKYLDAARSALGHALKDPESRKRILVARPDRGRDAKEAAEEVLQREPVTPGLQLEEVRQADRRARELARDWIQGHCE